MCPQNNQFLIAKSLMQPKTNLEKTQRVHVAIVRPGFEDAFKSELSERFKLEANVLCRAGVGIAETKTLPKLMETVFARQYLPRALRHQGPNDDLAKQFVAKRVDVLCHAFSNLDKFDKFSLT
jgi:hypothetical protein